MFTHRVIPTKTASLYSLLTLGAVCLFVRPVTAQDTPKTAKTTPPFDTNKVVVTKPIRSPKAPRGAKILFDGKDALAWQHDANRPAEWTVADGVLEVKPGSGNILTKENFGDYLLHIEFNIPLLADKHSQERGNSGVYQHGQYEIQVLDSFHNETYAHGGCAAIYGQKDPDVNAAKPPEEWQSYDITFRAARLDSVNKVMELPRITVYWNGIRVHNNVEITIGPTTASLGGPETKTGPIMLQDHGWKVRYRNIWIKPLKDALPTK